MAVSVNRSARWAAVAVLSAAGLALAGCSGDGGDDGPTSAASTASASPSPSETAGGDSGSPSASPSVSPTGSYEPATSEGPAKNVPVPEMPDAVKEPTEEGLEAAIEYWFVSSAYLKSTGDAEPLSNASFEECELCTDQIENWPRAYDAGGWAVIEQPQVEVMFTDVESDRLWGTVTFELTESAGEIYRSAGNLVDKGSGDGSEGVYWSASGRFSDTAGHWKIESLSPVNSEG
ncbi:DUF6318 family protein [Citricoccus sp. NPDC055426]|uniref:DUF6318 family protein n=1 Tax=Citricoccus sp. NPDC055426 TaxID=3155536 RepID=UPI003417DEB6